jgi:hypothetical protein
MAEQIRMGDEALRALVAEVGLRLGRWWRLHRLLDLNLRRAAHTVFLFQVLEEVRHPVEAGTTDYAIGPEVVALKRSL